MRLLYVFALVVAASGCGRLSFDRASDDVDAGSIDSGRIPQFDASQFDASIGDASTSDAAVAAVAGCVASEQVGVFTNNYNAGKPAGFFITNQAPAVASFTNGVIQIIPAKTALPAFSEVYTTADSFLRRRIFTEVPKMVNTATDTEVTFNLRSINESGTFVEITQSLARLSVRSWILDVETDLASRPFNPVSDRWWQIREMSGTLHFETSSDGIAWAEVVTFPTPTWFNNAEVVFAAGTSIMISGDLGTANFDNTFDCKTP
jgi:hypothetical protein